MAYTMAGVLRRNSTGDRPDYDLVGQIPWDTCPHHSPRLFRGTLEPNVWTIFCENCFYTWMGTTPDGAWRRYWVSGVLLRTVARVFQYQFYEICNEERIAWLSSIL